ncbi:MAG TPA: hypothetical protein VL442_21625 [Mucilaginibacter sp.]|jgi:hypothetical protein|nr:hypothetical protein [Mucilaginibacter sp.]
MEIYSLPLFKEEYEKLIKKNSYKNLTEELFNYFHGKEVSEVLSGTRLNHSKDEPYIKKRLSGSGGYRVYYLVIIKNQKAYLMFIHPKTGSLGSDDITDESKAKIYKDILEAIKSNQLYKVSLTKDHITFEYIKTTVSSSSVQ